MPQCIDGKEYLDLNKRINIPMEKIDLSTYPEPEIREKLAKNRSWSVCKSILDATNKRFIYDCIVNTDLVETRVISFEEVCKDFGWKSFKLINNNNTISYKI